MMSGCDMKADSFALLGCEPHGHGFFLSFAQIWRESIRDEALRTSVLTDPHSPHRFRVNGALFNVPEFYAAFPEMKPGDRLYRPKDQRPIIW
jgi:putative endopeptidase